jgi:hypothetical protein
MPKTKQEKNNYIDQFKRDNYDRIVILAPKGTKEKINHALQYVQGYNSVNAFVNAAIAEKLAAEYPSERTETEPEAPSGPSDAID